MTERTHDRILRRLGLRRAPAERPDESPYARRSPGVDLDSHRRPQPESVTREQMDRLIRDSYSDKPLLVWDHELPSTMRAPTPAKRLQLAEADQRALARFAWTSEQPECERAAWERVIEALPVALKTAIADAARAIVETEAELTEKRHRLATLPNDSTEVYITRRAHLISAIEGLEDLRVERQGVYQRLCHGYVTETMLDARAAAHRDQIQAALDATEASYQALLKEKKAAIGRLNRELNAIGAVRAQIQDPIEVEKHFGLIVSETLDMPAIRKRQREYIDRVTLALRRGVQV